MDDGRRGLDRHPADGSHRAHEGGQKVAPLTRSGREGVSAPATLGRRKPWQPRPAEMTHHSPFIAREQAVAGYANARKEQVERAGKTLTNPCSRAPLL
jgi:hypothetical protein